MKSANGIGEVVNLGSNFEISIKDTVQIIAEALGVNVKIIRVKIIAYDPKIVKSKGSFLQIKKPRTYLVGCRIMVALKVLNGALSRLQNGFQIKIT